MASAAAYLFLAPGDCRGCCPIEAEEVDALQDPCWPASSSFVQEARTPPLDNLPEARILGPGRDRAGVPENPVGDIHLSVVPEDLSGPAVILGRRADVVFFPIRPFRPFDQSSPVPRPCRSSAVGQGMSETGCHRTLARWDSWSGRSCRLDRHYSLASSAPRPQNATKEGFALKGSEVAERSRG